MLTVVAALIKKDGKYLIGKRLYSKDTIAGKFEFPGGKLEPGESEEEAIVREIKEEFGVEVKVNKFVTSAQYRYPTRAIDLRLYECDYVSGKFTLTDHSEILWVTIEEFKNYEFLPADKLLVDYLTN